MKKNKKGEPSNVPKEFMKLLKEMFPEPQEEKKRNKFKKSPK